MNSTENGRWRAGLCCSGVSGREFLVKYNSGMERGTAAEVAGSRRSLMTYTTLLSSLHHIYTNAERGVKSYGGSSSTTVTPNQVIHEIKTKLQ